MSIRNTILILACLVIAGAVYFILRDNILTRQSYSLKNRGIVAFGDSLVYGYGSTPGNDFVSDLSRDIGRPIVNLGVIGNTTADGLARIEEVTKQKPGVVILLLGGNDFLRHVSQKQTFQNLSNMIEQFRLNGIAVVLLGIQGGILTDPYRAQFEALAIKYNLAYVPNVLSGIVGDKSLMYDSVHPNDKGYRKIADKVYPVLQKVLN